MVHGVAGLSLGEQVAALKPAVNPIYSAPPVRGPGSSSAPGPGVQYAEGGGPPSKVSLSVGGTNLEAHLPSGAGKSVTVSLSHAHGGFTFSSATLKFDDAWEIKSGSLHGDSTFEIAGVQCNAKATFRVGKKGRVSSSTQSASLEAGVFSGSAKLKLGENGPSGRATITLNGDLPILVGAGQLLIKNGSKAKVIGKDGSFSSLTVHALEAVYKDAAGPLVSLSGKGRVTEAGFSASGSCKLERTLSKTLGGLTVSLTQGATQGEVNLTDSGIKKLKASFSVDVDDPVLGPLANGTFEGSYLNNGESISGTGTVTTKQDLRVGNGGGFYAIFARAGSSIGLTVDKTGKANLKLNVESEIGVGEQWWAKGKAKNVLYDGASIAGDFDLRINPNFSFTIGPLTTIVRSSGKMGVNYENGALSADGGDLSVDFEWNGKGFSLQWPQWSLSLGSISPIPWLKLPSFDLSGLLEWLKGLLPSGMFDWLLAFFDRLRLSLPDFSLNFPNFLALFDGFQLPFPSPFSLFGLPSFDWNIFLGDLWDRFLNLFGKFKFNISIPKLWGLFDGLSIPGFDGSWLANLFSGNGGLSLMVDGNIDLIGRGAEIPMVTGTNLIAMLLNHGTPLASLRSDLATFDGQTFAAKVSLVFEQGLGPKIGDYEVKLEQATADVTAVTGQPADVVLDSITGSLSKGGTKLGAATIGNLPLTEAGVDFSAASVDVLLGAALDMGNFGGPFGFIVRSGSNLT
ncbi:MAG: hypothetical protein KC561_12745, partial [Myxococcales bacterium]|nr:hypothetical protein [Myxococcales bacterium]